MVNTNPTLQIPTLYPCTHGMDVIRVSVDYPVFVELFSYITVNFTVKNGIKQSLNFLF